jgi:hypothetical protein
MDSLSLSLKSLRQGREQFNEIKNKLIFSPHATTPQPTSNLMSTFDVQSLTAPPKLMNSHNNYIRPLSAIKEDLDSIRMSMERTKGEWSTEDYLASPLPSIKRRDDTTASSPMFNYSAYEKAGEGKLEALLDRERAAYRESRRENMEEKNRVRDLERKLREEALLFQSKISQYKENIHYQDVEIQNLKDQMLAKGRLFTDLENRVNKLQEQVLGQDTYNRIEMEVRQAIEING